MSLEAALEEERLEILKLLEKPTISTNLRNVSNNTVSSPRSPPLIPRTTSPARGRPQPGAPMGGISSMILGAERVSHSASPPPIGTHNARSRESSPHTGNSPVYQHLGPSVSSSFAQRRASSGQTSSARSGSFSTSTQSIPSPFMSQGYQDTLASIYSESGPFQPGGMGLPPGSQNLARNSRAGGSSRRSGSPTVQSHPRSSSPTPGSLSLSSPLSSPPLNMGSSSSAFNRKLVTQNNSLIDLDYAYRRLDDDALRRSGGSLSLLPERGGAAAHVRVNSGESVTREGGVRLEKDLTYTTGEDGRVIAVESSDESEYSTDDGDSTRGRSKSTGEKVEGKRKGRKIDASAKKIESIDTGAPRKTMSLLAAAEEERMFV